MLVGLITRHFTWTNIEEDINYYRKPNTYDEKSAFFDEFLCTLITISNGRFKKAIFK